MRLLAGIVLMAAEMAVTAMVVVAPAPALVLMFNVSHAAAQDTDRREPAPMAVAPPSPQYSVDGLTLGAKVPFGSAVYRQYRCIRSEKFEGFAWCTKTNDNREARGPFKAWFSMLHAQNGVAVYVNRYQEPVHWGAHARAMRGASGVHCFGLRKEARICVSRRPMSRSPGLRLCKASPRRLTTN